MLQKCRPGDLVRNKATRTPYLVVGRSPQGYYVVDLTKTITPASMQIILHRGYADFDPDKELVDMSKEEAAVVKSTLEIVNSLRT